MDMIGQFEIHEVIGDGGMGVVYRGRDPRFDRPVAIKVLHEYLTREPEVLDRFKAEAVIQARLQHPGIVTVYDFVWKGEVAAIVMEYLPGKTLDAFIEEQNGQASIEVCRKVFFQLLGAIGYAHSNGLIHRDLKPSNVMLRWIGSTLQVKVMDFGIAKILGHEKHRTATSAKMGTLAYMSPEQVKSPKDVDHRSDIYSIGATLFEALTGNPVFEAETEFDLMRSIVTGVPPVPSNIRPGIDLALDAAVLRALEKDPDDRFQSCEEFSQALERSYSEGSQSVPQVETPSYSAPVYVAPPEVQPTEAAQPEPVASARRRTRSWVVPLAAVLTVAVVSIAVVVLKPKRTEIPPRTPPHQSAASPTRQVARGAVEVILTPPAMACLDGWQLPDGGQREVSSHRFSDLEARTYLLKAWKEGYRAESKSVSVGSGVTTTIRITLEHQ